MSHRLCPGDEGPIRRHLVVLGALTCRDQARVHRRLVGSLVHDRLALFDDTTMDACLIAAGQRAEHYEMAAYGTLIAWAQAMGHTEAAKLLQQTLDEEKAADQKLSDLAEGGINQSAADAAHLDEGEETMAGGSAGRKGAPAAKTGRR